MPIRDLVVGDLIHVSQGDRVPADCILVEEVNIVVDETLYDKRKYNVEKETSEEWPTLTEPDNHKLNVDPFLFCDSKVRTG